MATDIQSRLPLWLTFVLLIARPVFAEPTPTTPANTTFALDLYSRLAATEGNLFLSPYSISTCLALTYAGARTDTATQMARVLHFPSDPAVLATNFGALLDQLNNLQKKSALQLNLANAVWTQEDHPFLPEFLALARDQFHARLEQVDFKTAFEPTRAQINQWVAEQTKDKIKNLLPPGILDAQTRLVLVNAIYFKGTWAEPFKKSATANAPFNLTSTNQVTASFMHQETYFNYAETADCQLLELPYTSGNSSPTNDHLTMVILLPKQIDGIKTLEAALNEANLTQWLAQSTRQKINVTLPKFTTTAQFSLAETLSAMGMPLAFSDRADFSGLDGARDLAISAVVHKAFIAVDESGTEAAAATAAVGMALSMMPRPAPIFRADHPFLYLIRDPQSRTILFLGRLTNPTK